MQSSKSSSRCHMVTIHTPSGLLKGRLSDRGVQYLVGFTAVGKSSSSCRCQQTLPWLFCLLWVLAHLTVLSWSGGEKQHSLALSV